MKIIRNSWKLILALIVIVAAFCIVLAGRSLLSEIPLPGQRSFSSPSYVSVSENDTMLVIDSSKKRVSVLDSDRAVTTTITGGVRSDTGFYYAEYAVSDGKSIYIADVRFSSGGTKIASEHIMQYSLSGRFEKMIYAVDYEDADMPMQYGNIASVQIRDGKLTFLRKSETDISLYAVEDGTAELLRSVPLGEIQYVHHNMLYNVAEDMMIFTTKDGKMFTESDGGFVLTADWSDSRGETVIWTLAADQNGQVYYTDIGAGTITRLADGTNVLAGRGIPAEEAIIYRLACNDSNVLAFTDNTSVMLADTDGNILYEASAVAYSAAYTASRLVVWVCALLLALAALWICVKLITGLMKSSESKIFKTAVLLGGVIILSTTFVTINIMGKTSGRLNEKISYNLQQTVTSLSENSGNTFGDKMERVTTLGEYGTEDYLAIRHYLDVYCDAAYGSGSNMYYILYKHTDDLLYCFMDYEDTFGTIYPYSAYIGSGYDDVVNNNEIIVVEAEADAYGYWAFAYAPVYNSAGNIVGVVEIGTDLYGEQLQNQALVKTIILSTAVLILIILLLLSEATAFAECISKRRLAQAHEKRNVLEFVRPLAFLTFFSVNFSAAFIPQLSEQLFSTAGLDRITPTLGAAIPMSAQLLFVALMAFCGGFLVDRLSLRKVMLAGAAVQFSGTVLIAGAIPFHSYLLLVIGQIFCGCGMGAIVVCMNAMPTYADSEEAKNGLFSSLNVGVLSGVVVGAAIGAYIADAAGYFVTFLASAGVMLLAFLLGIFCVGIQRQHAPAELDDNGDAVGAMAPLQFFAHREVFSFLLLLMVPFLVIMYFKDYLFPLFASGAGYSDASIGNILLFGGALSIYLTPLLSRVTMKYLRAKEIAIVSSLLYVLALILFGLFQTLGMAIVAVFIISMASGLGMSNQGIYYSSLRVVNQFGGGKAMGVYSLFDNLGQTVGPLLFGALLIIGYGRACFVIAAAALVLLVIFALMNMRSSNFDKGKTDKDALYQKSQKGS